MLVLVLVFLNAAPPTGSVQDLARFNRYFIEKEEEAVIRIQVGLRAGSRAGAPPPVTPRL